jgi:lipid A 4'-phosphatase
MYCQMDANMRLTDHQRQGLFLAFAFALLAPVFSFWPGIDLWVTAQFYEAGQGFAMASAPWLEEFRQGAWDLTIVMLLIAVLGLVMALVKKPLLRIGARPWGFVALLYLLAPGLLVNGLLKSHWGRARPAETSNFGGSHLFSTAMMPSDQCLSNCSFVSGEVSATVACSVAIMVILGARRHDWPVWVIRVGQALALVLPLAVSAQRVVTGRHFLSDALFAGLFTLAIAWLLAGLLTGKPNGQD